MKAPTTIHVSLCLYASLKPKEKEFACVLVIKVIIKKIMVSVSFHHYVYLFYMAFVALRNYYNFVQKQPHHDFHGPFPCSHGHFDQPITKFKIQDDSCKQQNKQSKGDKPANSASTKKNSTSSTTSIKISHTQSWSLWTDVHHSDKYSLCICMADFQPL